MRFFSNKWLITLNILNIKTHPIAKVGFKIIYLTLKSTKFIF